MDVLLIQHELFLELNAFDPRWQQRYKRIKDAADAAGCTGLYYLWLHTPEGQRYRLETLTAPPQDCIVPERAL